MITINTIKNQRTVEGEEAIVVELNGLSTDTFPTEISGKKIDNGSIYVAIDTGDIYFYDLENEEWHQA